MGVSFLAMKSYYEYDRLIQRKGCKEVLALAVKVVEPILNEKTLKHVSHLIVATTCPDSIAPSVGQELNQKFYPYFENCHVIDILQGCAGGVTALLLGSQLAQANNSAVMVVTVDAAKKACDEDSKNYKAFGNGSFCCILEGCETNKGLLHYKSRQYKDLLNVVHVKLGHDADIVICNEKGLTKSPRRYLGLIMNNDLAIKLLRNAKSFYEEFLAEAQSTPDVMILHQVNSKILSYLKTVFETQGIQFINISEKAGNCGTASVGIALTHVEGSTEGKKVFICSFGTGGVITAGLWQF